MRLTADMIEHSIDKNPETREALYLVLAETLAAQALAAANTHGIELSEQNARRLVEHCADYPGVTMRRTGSSTIGDYATERVLSLSRHSPAL